LQHSQLNSSRASFAIANVLCPDVAQVLRLIGPDLNVIGEIAYLSDGPDAPNQFAVLNVPGIHAPLIVPVACLTPVDAGKENAGLLRAAG
jgi:hypothetical protein